MFRIVSKQLTFSQDKTRVLIQAVDGDYTCFEREVEGNHLNTPDTDLVELVLQKVYKDTFQKYAMNDAIKQSDETAEQVQKLTELLEKANSTIDAQASQLSESNKLMQTVKESLLEQANNNAELLDHADLLDYQLKTLAGHLKFTLPTDLPEEEEDVEETDKEGEEHHVVEET